MKVEFTYHQEFFGIALENYTEVKKLKRELDDTQRRLRESGKSSDRIALWVAEKNDRIGRLALIVVVFCALSLEAYINDYAISRLSKSYLKSYLDKLDLLSKWIVIPRITTGIQLDPGSKSLQDLSWLITLRNRIVHYKSKVVEVDKIQESDFMWEGDAKKAIETVRSLVMELGRIDEKVNIGWLRLSIEPRV